MRRSAEIGGLLGFRDGPVELNPEQVEALRAIAAGRDVLAVLPTGHGKSFVFQLPALATSGVTIVVSPLVSLMTDQALELNRAIGGAVRALVAPMRESNSRTGKVEVQQQLEGTKDHGIRLVYMSPERLCSRQFQDWVRRGVEAGVVRRIALDEAHTFVTWGDDFRPSFRRAERFLRKLKGAHPEMGLLALTATATTTVRNGLRRSIFALPEIPIGSTAVTAPADPPSFAYVVANPLRENLALWTRGLGPAEGGPIGEANVVLSVVSKLDRHAILYCLTVRQAVAVHNLIANALGEAARSRVLLYHGRLADTAKAAVANAFRQAPYYDPVEPGEFEPLIVVATSAFGLGINRADVRTVFCVSPATDLAGLYQQVGRAGRDRYPAIGLMLASNRSFRTLRFMATRDMSTKRISLILGELLKPRRWLSTQAVAREVFAEELPPAARTGMTEEDLRRREDDTHTLVVRILAELAAAGVLEDLGNFPQKVSLLRGTIEPDTADYRSLVNDLWTAVTDPAAQSVVELYERLAPHYAGELPDPGAMWSLLLALHAEGFIEVSQMIAGNVANRSQVTGIRLTGAEVPPGIVAKLNARQMALDGEVARVGDFFAQTGTCVNARFGSYFSAPPPPDMCAKPEVRCSYHWNTTEGSADAEPDLFGAFYRPAVAFANQQDFRKRELRDLPGLVEALLRYRRGGLAPNLISAVLRGSSHYMAKDRIRKPLWPVLVENRFFGRLPTLKRAELDAAIGELSDARRIIREGGFWRHPDAIAADLVDNERRERRKALAQARDAAGQAHDDARQTVRLGL